MQLSLHLILEQLKLETESPTHENPYFSGIEMYILGSSDVSGKSLLVATLSEALLYPKQTGLYFLCLRDRIVDDNETEDSMRGIYVVKKNMDIKELLNVVQRIFVRLQMWITNMNESIMNNQGLQHLLDLSEFIIGNHICIMDSTFKLLAATRNIKTDDEAASRLMKYGYHPEETVAKIRKNKRIEEYEKADENSVIISEDRLISQYITVKKVYKHNETFNAIVVMTCCEKEPTLGLLNLYDIFLNSTRYYLRKDRMITGVGSPFESLINELLDHSLTDPQEAQERLNLIGIPINDNFELMVLPATSTGSLPINRLVMEINTSFKDCKAVSYRRNLLILNICNDKSFDEMQKSRDRICGFSHLSGGFGVSNIFTNLLDIHIAYEQAHIAINIGEQLYKTQKNTKKFKYYHYEDYFVFHLLAHGFGSNVIEMSNSFAVQSIKTIHKYDQEHKTNVLELLRTYLEFERSATKTCAHMHMHRNTILYHIQRVGDLLDIDLDDADIRLKLLLGLKMFDMGR